MLECCSAGSILSMLNFLNLTLKILFILCNYMNYIETTFHMLSSKELHNKKGIYYICHLFNKITWLNIGLFFIFSFFNHHIDKHLNCAIVCVCSCFKWEFPMNNNNSNKKYTSKAFIYLHFELDSVKSMEFLLFYNTFPLRILTS